MRATICKTFTFSAAHQLPNHDGKCVNEHGHNYRAEIAVRGAVRSNDGTAAEGMVCDFSAVKRVWRESCEPLLDHVNLNVTIGPEVGVTTAENIAAWIFLRMRGGLAQPLEERGVLWSVTVWETDTCCACVNWEDVS